MSFFKTILFAFPLVIHAANPGVDQSHTTPLHEAVQNNDMTLAQSLIHDLARQGQSIDTVNNASSG